MSDYTDNTYEQHIETVESLVANNTRKQLIDRLMKEHRQGLYVRGTRPYYRKDALADLILLCKRQAVLDRHKPEPPWRKPRKRWIPVETANRILEITLVTGFWVSITFLAFRILYDIFD